MKFVVCATLIAYLASASEQSQTAGGNPIRKVVNMLKALEKKVEAEQKQEADMFKKFQCYCKNGASTLGASISANDALSTQLDADIKEGTEKVKQLKADVAQHEADREDAKQAMAKATAIRNKEATTFAALKKEQGDDAAAMQKAIKALEKGMGAAFVQTAAASELQQFVTNKDDMDEDERSMVLAFLTGGHGTNYAPASGEIVGILKNILDTTHAGLRQATEAEEAAIKAFNEEMTAQKKRVGALSKMIEQKSKRAGDLAVDVQRMKNERAEAADAVEDDQRFLADLQANCGTKEAENAENMKQRQEELIALSETIGILNNDDALDAFGKSQALNKGASFVQVESTAAAMKARALNAVHTALRAGLPFNGKLDLIALALHAKKGADFSSIIKMIDDMVVTLKKEQTDDDTKKEYCESTADEFDDRRKGQERDISDANTNMASQSENIAALEAELETLAATMKANDEAVAEASAQRKAAVSAYKELVSGNAEAKRLIDLAKNRLQKFYNPALAKFAQVSVHSQADATVDPGPAPETAGAYKKSHKESGGILAMLDMLVKEINKETTTAETDEKNDAKQYEQMMSDAAQQKDDDTKSLAEKRGAKADLEARLHKTKAGKASTQKELKATMDAIANLHNECSWLLQYHETRANARAQEIDNLQSAKAVLSGADYSFLQLRGSRRK